jgi:hypothetical protein
MEQLFLRSDNPNEDDPELTWVNVGIALSFILVDGTHSLDRTNNSHLLDYFGPWHRKVRARSFSTMSNPINTDGTI